jgi:hypothetical protein
MGLAKAITSRLIATDGVLSLSFRENVSDVVQVIDGVTMVPHSLYVCVDGGTNVDVADTLTATKDGGCNYNNGASGNPQTVPVTNIYSGQTIDVLFDRPDLIQILVRVTVNADASVQDPITSTQQAILDYANGLIEGEEGLIVGMNVSTFELAGAVNKENPAIYVQNMETSLVSPLNYSNAEIPIEIWQRALIQQSSIIVDVNP